MVGRRSGLDTRHSVNLHYIMNDAFQPLQKVPGEILLPGYYNLDNFPTSKLPACF